MVLVADLPAYSTATVKALEAKGTPAPAVPADAAAGVVVPVPDAKAKESISEVSAGVMVALVPPAEVAASLAVEGGLPVEELHVTLAYLGQDIDDPEALATLVQAWALATPPLECSISGIGVFAPTVGSDGLPVTYASVDCADLPAARQRLVDLLTASGQPVATTHGFTPHMTLAYSDEIEADAASVVTSWTSESVVLFVGGERTAFPLSGTPQTAAEADMAATWARTYAVRRAQAVAELV
jgi:2'-5' RNA ligase